MGGSFQCSGAGLGFGFLGATESVSTHPPASKVQIFGGSSIVVPICEVYAFDTLDCDLSGGLERARSDACAAPACFLEVVAGLLWDRRGWAHGRGRPQEG